MILRSIRRPHSKHLIASLPLSTFCFFDQTVLHSLKGANAVIIGLMWLECIHRPPVRPRLRASLRASDVQMQGLIPEMCLSCQESSTSNTPLPYSESSLSHDTSSPEPSPLASIKMSDHLGPHFSVTIVAVCATIMAPVPYILFKYGHQIKAMSRNVQNKA